MAGNNSPRRKAQDKSIARVPCTVHALDGMAVLMGRRRADLAAVPQTRQQAALMALPLNEDERKAVATHFNAAIVAIVSGVGQAAHYDSLMYGVHVGIVLAERGFGEECLPEFYTAMEGLARMNERYTQRAIMGFDGEGLRAIRAINDLHDQQLAVATRTEINAAIQEVRRRVQDVAAGLHAQRLAA